MMKSIMAICTVVLLSTPVAMAQQRGVCVADIKAKCAGVEPGELLLDLVELRFDEIHTTAFPGISDF